VQRIVQHSERHRDRHLRLGCISQHSSGSSVHDLDRISTTCGLAVAQVVVLTSLCEHGESIKPCRSAKHPTERLLDDIVLSSRYQAIQVTCRRHAQTGCSCSPIDDLSCSVPMVARAHKPRARRAGPKSKKYCLLLRHSKRDAVGRRRPAVRDLNTATTFHRAQPHRRSSGPQLMASWNQNDCTLTRPKKAA
jgi:hypothetical protein